MAKELYGEAAPAARAAWTAYSEAFRNYPIEWQTVYYSPVQMGPANLLYAEKTDWPATMVNTPYDDFKAWSEGYRDNRAGWIAQMRACADGFEKGCSLMEGVAFSLKDCYGTLEEMRLPVKRIFLIGGGARSKLWSEIVCNVFNCKVAVPTPGDASFGACLLAGTGVGVFRDVKEAVAKCLHVDRTIEPDAKLALEYEKKNRYDLAMPMWQKVLDNPETVPDVRFEAATHLANCQSYMLLRDQAVKTIEDAVAVKDMKGAQRAKLLLQRVSVLLSDKVYEEEFTVEQLGEAAKAIAQALKNSGASEEQRFAAIFRLVNAYHSGGEFKRANEFSDKMLEDVKLCAHNKGQLYLKQAEAHRALAYRIKDEDDRKNALKKAAQMYRIARKTCDCQKCFNRNVLKQQGFLAEELGDWKTAQACYGEEVKMYSSEEEDLKAGCVARISKVTKKLAGEERKKDVSFDATDDGTEIELDD